MNELQRTLAAEIKRAAASLPSRTVGDLINFLLYQGDQSRQLVVPLTRALIGSDIAFDRLLLLMMRCQRLLTSAAHYRQLERLQASLLQAHETRWRETLELESNAQVMRHCMQAWRESGKMVIYNFFHQIPVQASVVCCDLTERRIYIEPSPAAVRVFSVASNLRDVMSTSQDGKHKIVLRAVSSDKKRIGLELQTIGKSHRELREHVRVEPEPELQSKVQLSHHGMPIQASIVDLSVGGVGIGYGEELSLVRGEELNCLWPEQKMFLEAIVCWVQNDLHGGRAGLKFKSLGPFSDVMQKLVVDMQQAWITRLRTLSPPAWMV